MNESLISSLKKLRLSGMIQELERQSKDPATDSLTVEERLEYMVMAEKNLRESRKFQKNLKLSNLRIPEAVLDESIDEPDRKLDSNLLRETAKCEWVRKGENLILAGMTGAGKTYYANVLGVSALNKHLSVRYFKCHELIHQLERWIAKNELGKNLQDLIRTDLLILDDFGMMELDPRLCRIMFEIIDSRDSILSTMIVTQMEKGELYESFQDKRYGEAIISRLYNHARQIEFIGKDMRRPLAV